MADLAVWQRTIVDEKGDIIPGAEVSVRSYPGGSLITLYEGPDGTQVKGNPFSTGSDGFARFWAESQRAEIIAHGAGSTIRWIVDLLNADEVIGDAVTEATAAAAVAVGEAEAAADRAEAARDAAQLNAHIYSSTAAGLAATTDGDYFSVPSEDDDEYLILYRNDSGSATEVQRYPSAGIVQRVTQVLDQDRSDPELLVAVTDANDVRTWLEASKKRGGPTEHSIHLLRQATPLPMEALAPGLLYALTDANGVLTDLRVSNKDGKIPDDVMSDWASRIREIIGAGGYQYTTDPVRTSPALVGGSGPHAAGDMYFRDGELLPVQTNMQRIAGWGSSSMFRTHTYLSDFATQVGASAYLGGKGGETASQIAARIGSIPVEVYPVGGVIPASGPVAVEYSGTFFPNASLQPFTGWLHGIHGTLSPSGSEMTFTRTESGSAVTVGTDPEPFIPEDGPLERASMTLLWMGKNDLRGWGRVDHVIEWTDRTFDWLSPFVRRSIVMGHFVNRGSSQTIKEEIWEVNAAHAKRYGPLYFDVDGYVTGSDIWADADITPTQQDLDDQAAGEIPISLSADNAHLSPLGYELVFDRLVAHMNDLGFYQ